MARLSLEEVRSAIQELSPGEREVLYVDVLSDIEVVDPEIEQTWIDEIKRRVADIDAGRVKMIPAEQVLSEIEQLIQERRADDVSSSGKD